MFSSSLPHPFLSHQSISNLTIYLIKETALSRDLYPFNNCFQHSLGTRSCAQWNCFQTSVCVEITLKLVLKHRFLDHIPFLLNQKPCLEEARGSMNLYFLTSPPKNLVHFFCGSIMFANNEETQRWIIPEFNHTCLKKNREYIRIKIMH